MITFSLCWVPLPCTEFLLVCYSSQLLISPCCLFLVSLPKIVAKTSVELSPFSSNTFTVWVLRVSLYSFKLIFMSGIRGRGTNSFFCAWLSNFPNAIYWKDCSFPSESYGLPCQILVDCMCMCTFISGLSILFHWPMCLFLWAFIKLKMRNCAFSFLFLFFLAIQDLLCFHTNFRVFFFSESCNWNFERNCIESIDGEMLLRCD